MVEGIINRPSRTCDPVRVGMNIPSFLISLLGLSVVAHAAVVPEKQAPSTEVGFLQQPIVLRKEIPGGEETHVFQPTRGGFSTTDEFHQERKNETPTSSSHSVVESKRFFSRKATAEEVAKEAVRFRKLHEQ